VAIDLRIIGTFKQKCVSSEIAGTQYKGEQYDERGQNLSGMTL
jgi:hypothetical protein